jgi:hypothetical protein
LEIVIVIVLAYFNKHGPNPSYTEDRTLSAEGSGWQSRINAALRKAADLP